MAPRTLSRVTGDGRNVGKPFRPGGVGYAPLAIDADPVSPTVVDVAYVGFTPAVTGGKAPYAFRIWQGALPTGLTLDPDTGEVAGIPTEVETAAGIVIRATDAHGHVVDLPAFEIEVTAA